MIVFMLEFSGMVTLLQFVLVILQSLYFVKVLPHWEILLFT